MSGRKHQVGAKSKYPAAFRREVALSYEQGDLSYAQVADRYGLKGRETVREWVKWLRKKSEIAPMTQDETTDDEKHALDAKDLRIKELEKQLEAERLLSLGLSTMIDIAEEELGVSIRKKSGSKPSRR
jgi:transposase